ncbi:uncharacterized protein [Clytia hemisphaerica]
MKNILVYCGSCSQINQVYLDAAAEFGGVMVEKELDLIYGSGKTGLMGCVAKAVHDGGRQVTGIIPKFFTERFEGPIEGYGEIIVIDTMHARKAAMAERADAFVALPGGYGTLEELFEIITWRHLGIHKKPIGILNVNGYYDKLLEFIDHSKNEGFIYKEAMDIIVCESDPKLLIEKLCQKSEDLTLS